VDKGVIVSANGYTKAALKYGKNKKIDMLLIADTRGHAWKRVIHVPILIRINEISSFSFESRIYSPHNFIFPSDLIVIRMSMPIRAISILLKSHIFLQKH
jgi:hypothetical protein